jgi:hypothetical protein
VPLFLGVVVYWISTRGANARLALLAALSLTVGYVGLAAQHGSQALAFSLKRSDDVAAAWTGGGRSLVDVVLAEGLQLKVEAGAKPVAICLPARWAFHRETARLGSSSRAPHCLFVVVGGSPL